MPRGKDLKEGYNNFYIEPLKEYQEIADFYVDHRALPIARRSETKAIEAYILVTQA